MGRERETTIGQETGRMKDRKRKERIGGAGRKKTEQLRDREKEKTQNE